MAKRFFIAAALALGVTSAQAGRLSLPLEEGVYVERTRSCPTETRRRIAVPHLTYRRGALANGHTVWRIRAVRRFEDAFLVTLSRPPADDHDSARGHRRPLIWRFLVADSTRFFVSGSDRGRSWSRHYRFCGRV